MENKVGVLVKCQNYSDCLLALEDLKKNYLLENWAYRTEHKRLRFSLYE